MLAVGALIEDRLQVGLNHTHRTPRHQALVKAGPKKEKKRRQRCLNYGRTGCGWKEAAGNGYHVLNLRFIPSILRISYRPRHLEPLSTITETTCQSGMDRGLSGLWVVLGPQTTSAFLSKAKSWEARVQDLIGSYA